MKTEIAARRNRGHPCVTTVPLKTSLFAEAKQGRVLILGAVIRGSWQWTSETILFAHTTNLAWPQIGGLGGGVSHGGWSVQFYYIIRLYFISTLDHYYKYCDSERWAWKTLLTLTISRLRVAFLMLPYSRHFASPKRNSLLDPLHKAGSANRQHCRESSPKVHLFPAHRLTVKHASSRDSKGSVWNDNAFIGSPQIFAD